MKRSLVLSELCRETEVLSSKGVDGVTVEHVTMDSRQVRAGSLYVAVAGSSRDGHDFISEALDRGATAVMGTRESALKQASCWICVPDSRRGAAHAAYALAGRPGTRMKMIGITGTNGKTTGTYLGETVTRAMDLEPGIIGTVECRWTDQVRHPGHTTPEAPVTCGVLGDMADDGVDVVWMEVSSHGIAQDRVEGMEFSVVVFTNLSQDHLDYHKTMEEYGQTKLRWIRGQLERGPACLGAVVNVDDEWGRRIADWGLGRVVCVGLEHPRAEVTARNLLLTLDRSSFDAVGPWGVVHVDSPMVGRHNVMNILTQLATCWLLGWDASACAKALGRTAGAPGRLEPVENPFGCGIWVDYAHTPDALDKVGEAMRSMVQGRIITVFGAGGDRDPGKRPLMGAAVAKFSDLTLVTSDNPRSEKPLAIIQDIVKGIPEDHLFHHTLLIPDRRLAIETAVLMARPGDGVVIAGKGHEKGWIVGNQILEFDDVLVAREAIALRERGRA